MKHKIFIHQWSALPMLLCVVLILHGCISSHKPPQSVDFKKIDNLGQLEGIYQNLGISEPGQPPMYLSELIWKTGIAHSALTAVEVRVIQSENILLVKALRGVCVVIESTFIEGKDFDIREGRIRLKKRVAIHPNETEDVLIGAEYENIELGLDQEGHGKYKGKWFGAAVAYLMIPFAAGEIVEVKFVKEPVNKNPRDADPINLAQCKHDLGLYEESIEICKQAILSKPDNRDAYHILGLNYEKLGRSEEAIEAYKQAIFIRPDSPATYHNLGLIYDQLGRSEEAIEAYKEAIRIEPDLESSHYNLGRDYWKMGRYEEAIEAYKQAILIEPDDASALYNLGEAYFKLERYQEAIEAYKEVLRISPNWETPAYFNLDLGIAYFKVGRYREAMMTLKRAISIKPDNADAHYYLGLNYLSMGKRKLALEEYDILKNLDKDKADKLLDAINR